MFEKVNYIKLSGTEYPLKCDILVLERIQDKYDDLAEFENGISGFTPNRDENGEIVRNEEGLMVGTVGIPNLKMLKDALLWMIEEGIDIEKENGKTTPVITNIQLLRKVDIPPRELGKILHEEFNQCFVRKNG